MTFVVLGLLVLLAILGPRFGVDTRESRQGFLVRTQSPRPLRRRRSTRWPH